MLFYPKRFFNCHPQLGSKVISAIYLKVVLITAKIKFLGLASVTRINTVTHELREQVKS
jgi:hypothetical protein